MSNANIMLPDEYDFRVQELRKLKKQQNKLFSELAKVPINVSDEVPGEGSDVIENQISYNSEKIKKIEGELRNANVVSPAVQSEVVRVGSSVSILIEEEVGSMVNSFTIGGINTPIEGRYSINAPLVQAIIGAKVGEVIEIIVNNIEKKVSVEKISFDL